MLIGFTIYVVVVAGLSQVRKSYSQTTTINPDTCTYSFVVPQNDAPSTCQSMSDQRVDQMQKMITELQNKVKLLKSGKQKGTNKIPPFTCGCTNTTKIAFAYKDCEDVKVQIGGVSGIYDIEVIKNTGPILKVEDVGRNRTSLYILLDGVRTVPVYCDLTSFDTGWIVIMRRHSLNVSFDRTWREYKEGFGDMDGDFWLGLENMHDLTSNTKYMLWIIVHDTKHVPHVMPYDSFSIGDESTNYGLKVSGYHGVVTSMWPADQAVPFVSRDSIYFENAELSTTRFSSYWGRTRGIPDYNMCANMSSTEPAGRGGWWFYETYHSACGDMNFNAPTPYYLDHITKVEMKITSFV